MKVFRYLLPITVILSTVVLPSCSNNTNIPSADNSSPTTTASPATTEDHSEHSMTHNRKININNAILSELDKLEAQLGIPALSNKIQASRPYASTEELVSKQVITQEQYDRIKDQVTIEDIVLEGEAKDVDYMTKLSLMKGHLLVAKELLDLKKPDQAEPHIGHPVEEIYADVEDQLAERNVPEFKTTLISAQDLVKAGAKDATKVDTEFKASMQAVEGAIAALPETQRQTPSFILQVINGLLETANAEYTASISNGKISALIEYQDSRGFVEYAEQLYNQVAPQLEKDNPTANQTLKTSLAELKTAWPSPLAPATPVKTPEEVTQLVKTIQKASTELAMKK